MPCLPTRTAQSLNALASAGPQMNPAEELVLRLYQSSYSWWEELGVARALPLAPSWGVV